MGAEMNEKSLHAQKRAQYSPDLSYELCAHFGIKLRSNRRTRYRPKPRNFAPVLI